MMNGEGKSDRPIVPEKPPNKAERTAAEVVEGRGLAKGNAGQQNAPRTQCRKQGAPSALGRVRQAARKDRKAKFTALLHHVTIERLRSAFLSLKRKAAPGTDGVTWDQYAQDLETNIRDLHMRVHCKAYRARPSRRVYIPKADGRQRPLGVASLEDKIVQRAVVEVLSAIYEGDFLGFSYGFRPGRSQHHALDALATAILRKKVNYVLDADIRGFFDAINHEWMLKFLEHRIADRRVVRLIRKWLSAGVMEDGTWSECNEGTPQGATVSPLLANIYLHYVLDLWVESWRKRHARGDVIITRWANDFIVGFQHPSDAVRFLEELRERLRRFSLELHPDKTRLIRFGRFADPMRRARGERKPETFHFLGFTHVCGKGRNGAFVLTRRTMKVRMRAKLQQVKAELKQRMHQSIMEQGKWQASVVRGHFAYYGVPTHAHSLAAFRDQVGRYWRTTLRRRSQVNRVSWHRVGRHKQRWLPPVRIQHPWPEVRFDARTRGKSPVR